MFDDNVLKNINVRELVYSGDDIPFADVVRTYVHGENFVDGDLPRRMRQFQAWYKDTVKETNKVALMMAVKEEHYFQEYSVVLYFAEIFQLYNLRALDKGIMSSYCL